MPCRGFAWRGISIEEWMTLILFLHSDAPRLNVWVHPAVGASVAQARIAASGRDTCREGKYGTTACQQRRAVERRKLGLRGGAGTAVTSQPHGPGGAGQRSRSRRRGRLVNPARSRQVSAGKSSRGLIGPAARSTRGNLWDGRGPQPRPRPMSFRSAAPPVSQPLRSLTPDHPKTSRAGVAVARAPTPCRPWGLVGVRCQGRPGALRITVRSRCGDCRGSDQGATRWRW
jgi:hypothetical protein